MPRLKVTHVDAVTPRIRRVELQNADGGELPAFTAGAHVDLELGNGEARSYSLLNDAGRTAPLRPRRTPRGKRAGRFCLGA